MAMGKPCSTSSLEEEEEAVAPEPDGLRWLWKHVQYLNKSIG
jgi:hypothetical protein